MRRVCDNYEPASRRSLAAAATSRVTLEAPLTTSVSSVHLELLPSTPIVSRGPAASCYHRLHSILVLL
jgi:hypothetical protein